MSPATAGDLYIRAIHLGDIDALAEGVSLRESPPASLEILLKANGGTLESVVKDDKEKPLPTAQVWLVPDAPKQQQRALYGDCRTDANGGCRITGITPGEYHAYAFPTGVTPGRRDPDALKALKQYGKPVTFAKEKALRRAYGRAGGIRPLAVCLCDFGHSWSTNLLVFPALCPAGSG